MELPNNPKKLEWLAWCEHATRTAVHAVEASSVMRELRELGDNAPIPPTLQSRLQRLVASTK